MRFTTAVLGLTTLQLCACLNFSDLFNYTDTNSGSSPSDTNDASPTSGETLDAPPDTITDNTSATTIEPASTASGDTTATTGADTYGDGCADIVTPKALLVPGVIWNGSDYPHVAVDSECQIYTTGGSGMWNGCTLGPGSAGPAYLAHSDADGSCHHVTPLAGVRGTDIVLTTHGAVIGGFAMNPEQPPVAMLVRVADDSAEPEPFDPSDGTTAYALQASDDGIFVTGSCDGNEGSSMWVAHYDHELKIVAEVCIDDLPSPGRAITRHGDTLVIVGQNAAPAVSTKIGLFPVEDLAGHSFLDVNGVNTSAWGPGAVSTSHGVTLALSCTGATIEISGTAVSADCESVDEQQEDVLYNVAMVQFDGSLEPVRIDVFGGVDGQRTAALAADGDNTLWLAGSNHGRNIAFGDYSAVLADGDVDHSAGFVVRFDLSDADTLPSGLYVIDNLDAASLSRATDIAIDKARVVVTGYAKDAVCLRPGTLDPDPDDCDNVMLDESGQDFFAFIPK